MRHNLLLPIFAVRTLLFGKTRLFRARQSLFSRLSTWLTLPLAAGCLGVLVEVAQLLRSRSSLHHPSLQRRCLRQLSFRSQRRLGCKYYHPMEHCFAFRLAPPCPLHTGLVGMKLTGSVDPPSRALRPIFRRSFFSTAAPRFTSRWRSAMSTRG